VPWRAPGLPLPGFRRAVPHHRRWPRAPAWRWTTANEEAIARWQPALPVRFEAAVLLDGEDVTDAIRTEEPWHERLARVRLPAVRAALVGAAARAFAACPAWWPTGATWAR
jgi:hypothetical protein